MPGASHKFPIAGKIAIMRHRWCRLMLFGLGYKYEMPLESISHWNHVGAIPCGRPLAVKDEMK
jgi:hypothetical protein